MINLEDSYGLDDVIKSYNVDDGSYKIEFEYFDVPTSSYIEMEETSSKMVSVLVTVTNKETEEKAKFPVSLVEIPIRTSMGYKIDGTFYEVCTLNQPASGWYQLNTRNGMTMELVPKSGRKLVFSYDSNVINVRVGSKSSKINLGVFLTAFTGMSSRELIKKIGLKNRVISRSLSGNYTYAECIDTMLSTLLGKFGSRDFDVAYPKEFRERELKKKLGPNYIRLDKLSRARYDHTSSFLNRADGLILAQDVLGYKKDTLLNSTILTELDNSDVDTIFVYKNGNKIYEIKKYKAEGLGLCPEEIFTSLNMYCNNLSGFNLFDDRYDELNRNMVPLEEMIKTEVSNRLSTILSSIDTFLVGNRNSLIGLSASTVFNEDTYDFLRRCKIDFRNSQGAETTNGIAYISKSSKITMNMGGPTNDKIISIKPSEQSTVDHFHIPEGPKIGQVAHLTMSAEIKDDGMIYAPYVKVTNGVIDNTLGIISLNPRQRDGLHIAPWDADLTQSKVRCYYGDRLVVVHPSEVDYKEAGPLQTVSLPTAIIPFLQFSDGKRLTMGGNQNKQTLTCLKSEAPLVSTGALCLDKNVSQLVLRATDILDKIYVTNGLINYLNYDEFMKGKVKLQTIDNSAVGYRTYLFETTFDEKAYQVTVGLPFCKKADDHSMFHFHLNYSPNHTYVGKEIVLYNSCVDIKKYELHKFVNLGSLEVPEDAFDFDNRLGCNFLTAIKSSGIPNMDDGICISDELWGTGKLSHVRLIEIKEELRGFSDGVREEFGIKHETHTHTRDGLPKRGTWLQPRSKVIGKTVYKNGISDVRYVLMDMDAEGEVIYSSISKNIATVVVAVIADFELGDKLAGDHGNKGVIGKIIPKKDMPYMEDGTPIQMTLNPLGIPSRMNFSQLFVGALGFILKYKANARMILTPSHPDSYEIAEKYFEQYGSEPVQLYDGRTGLKFDRLTNVGVWYMKKLSHTTKSKMNNCGSPGVFNPITGQPNKGKSISGGQTMGEMETWALEGSGATGFLQELFSVKSDDAHGREKLDLMLESGTDFANFGSNHNMTHLQAELRMLGCEIELEDGDKNYRMRPLLDKDIRGLAALPLKMTKDALQDNTVFGAAKGTKGLHAAKTKWSYIDLGCEIVHPIWIYKSFLPAILFVNEFYEVTESGVTEVVSENKALGKNKVKDLIDGKYFLDFTEITYGVKGSKTERLLDNPKSGISALVDLIKLLNLEDVLSLYYKLLSNLLDSNSSEENKRPLLIRLNHVINSVKNLIDLGMTGKDLIISSFPVIPKSYRFDMKNGRSSNFDVFYSRIISACQTSAKSDPTKVYLRVLEFIGLDEKRRLSAESKTKNILEYFTGKGSDNKSKGATRVNALSKVVGHSGRTVIIPGEIKLGKVGLPRQAAYNTNRIRFTGEIRRKFFILEDTLVDIDPLIDALEVADITRCIKFFEDLGVNDKDDCIKMVNACDDVMRDILSKSAVAVGRQPTLHTKGIRGLVPEMVEGNALRIHPLLCDAYNADFDGDQMWFAFGHSEQSKRELLVNCSPSTGLFSEKDGSVCLTPSQDILLGLYLATMTHDNVLDLNGHPKYELDCVSYYSNLNSLKYDVQDGRINIKDLICFTNPATGYKYFSTVGRILLNSIVPNGFTSMPYESPFNTDLSFINPKNYRALKFDGLIRKNGGGYGKNPYKCVAISDLVSYSVSLVEGDSALAFLDELVEFGIEYCVKSGITLHLNDFLVNEVSDKYSKVYNEFVEECDKLFKMGLITEEDRKINSIKAANFCVSTVKKSIMAQYERNNNLFIIIDSGARGNESQVMRSVGLIGVINKTNAEQIETPIMTGFKRGLSSSDIFIMANGTRNGIATVQKDTGKVGEMTRALVFLLAGFKVTEEDCGCSDNEIDVDYDAPITKDIDLLDKVISNKSDLFLDTLNITKEGIINSNVVKYIFKHKISEVPLSDGSVFKVRYKVSALFRNQMVNKLGKGLEHLERGFVITNETIDSIERNQFKKIKARTVLTCNSKDGVCARCYGILHNNKKLPPIGYAAGVIAAQSIGEPTTQLNLNTINSGGAGNSTAGAVDLFKGMVGGNVPSAFEESIVAQGPCFAHVADSGDFNILSLSGVKFKVAKGDLTVVNGEQVFAGQEVTKGVLNVNNIPVMLNHIQIRMYRQLKTYYKLFTASNIHIDARHFEVLVRAQLGYEFIISSDDPNIPFGSYATVPQINASREAGFGIHTDHSVMKSGTLINIMSGHLASVCHHDPAMSITRIMCNPNYQVNKSSFIADIASGVDLVDGSKPKPTRIKFKNMLEDKEFEDTVYNDNLAELDVFKAVDAPDVAEIKVDFGNLFGEEFNLDFGNDVAESVAVGVEHDNVLGDMDVFGGGYVEEKSTTPAPSPVVEDMLQDSNVFSLTSAFNAENLENLGEALLELGEEETDLFTEDEEVEIDVDFD